MDKHLDAGAKGGGLKPESQPPVRGSTPPWSSGLPSGLSAARLSCELLLEEKLCDNLGLVRGCRVTLVDIVPSVGQVIGSHDPSLSPFVLA